MAQFGGNTFKNCPVPLAFNGRYFILEPGPLFSVVLSHSGKPVFEILKNEPAENPLTDVTKNAAGIITVSEKETGKFLYKFRPESETSIVFGKIDGDTTTVVIGDKNIKVGTNTFQNNMVSGCGAGIVIDDKGDMGMGCPIPPELNQLFQR